MKDGAAAFEILDRKIFDKTVTIDNGSDRQLRRLGLVARSAPTESPWSTGLGHHHRTCASDFGRRLLIERLAGTRQAEPSSGNVRPLCILKAFRTGRPLWNDGSHGPQRRRMSMYKAWMELVEYRSRSSIHTIFGCHC
jgi:hypothetical protein